MGKTKTKIMDDSQSEEKKPIKGKSKAGQVQSELAKKRAGDSEEGSTATPATTVESEEVPGDTEEAGPAVKQQDPEPTKKTTSKPKKGAKQRSKKYQEASEKVERTKFYPLKEAVERAKQTSYSKFDGTLELHINTA